MPFEIAPGLLKALYPPLFYQYVKGVERVFHLYNGDFRKVDSFHKRALFLQKKKFPQGTTQLLVDSGSKSLQNKKREKREEIEEPYYIITGQQPGILGGPLYVAYKALTAITLAEEMQEQLNINIRPLFWVAGEDHNIFSMTRTFIPPLNKGGALRLRFDLDSFGPPAGAIKIPPQKMQELISKLEKLTIEQEDEGEYDRSILTMLQKCSFAEHTLSSWFVALLSHLFAGRGLCFVDPLLASRNNFYTELLLQVVEEAPIFHSLISTAENEIIAKGFTPQVRRSGKESFLMIVWKGKRQVLWQDGDNFFNSNKDFFASSRDLKNIIKERPDLFSPNVLLRPVFQDSMFANLAYVCGPGELGYMAQIKGVYDYLGLKMPLLYPRKGITLVEPKLQTYLQYYGAGVEEVVLQARSKPRRKKSGKKEDPRFEILRENLWPRSRPQERVFNIFPYMIRHGLSFWESFSKQFDSLPAGHHLFLWGDGSKDGS